MSISSRAGGSYDGGVTEAETDAVVTAGRPARARWRWTVTAAFGLGGITVSAWGPPSAAAPSTGRAG
jgi:hypothetical protein